MVLNQEQFDAFRMEIATFGNIPILSQYCGIGCVFCKSWALSKDTAY